MNARFDVGELGNAEKTPQGGYRVPAHLTRSGVFSYSGPDGKPIREYRPAEEVFHADSLATLPDAPVTVGHPGMVSPDNHAQHANGHVREARQDGDRIAANLVIQGRRAIKAVEKGIRQVSCGYQCRVDETPGVTPSGEHYDRVQRDIRYNHVALVDVGRAGPDIRLRLDSEGNQSVEEKRMDKMERVDGVEYAVDTEAHKAAIARRDDAAKQAKSEADKMQARLDKAEADLKTALATIAEMPARLDAAAKARVSLLDDARKVLGMEAKFDGLADGEIRRQVAAKANPTLKLDGQSEDYVKALYDVAVAGSTAEAAREDAATKAHGSIRQALVNPGAGGDDIMLQAQREHAERNRNAWKTKERA